MLLGQVISSLSHLSSYCLSFLNGTPTSFLELYPSFWWVDNYLEGDKCSWHHPNCQDYRLCFTGTSLSNHIWFSDGSEIGRSPVSMISRLMAFSPTCDANWARFRQHSLMVKQELKDHFYPRDERQLPDKGRNALSSSFIHPESICWGWETACS